MSVNENDWDAIDLQNKRDFFSDAWKEVYGSRPGRINYDWFKSLTNEETPSGPNLSIILMSTTFQKKSPIFFEGCIKIILYNSSKYHLLTKKLYKGLFN